MVAWNQMNIYMRCQFFPIIQHIVRSLYLFVLCPEECYLTCIWLRDIASDGLFYRLMNMCKKADLFEPDITRSNVKLF